MVGLNPLLLNVWPMLLGLANYANSNTVGWPRGISGSGPSKAHDNSSVYPPYGLHAHGGCSKLDPCVLDPPDVFIDPLVGIHTDDESLVILVNLTWPIRDLSWHLTGFENTMLKKELPAQWNQGDVTYTEQETADIVEFIKDSVLAELLEILKKDTTKQQKSAMKKGKDELVKKGKKELKIREANITFGKNSATLKHQGFMKSDPISTKMASLGYMTTGASLRYMKSMKMKNPSCVGLKYVGILPECETKFSDLIRPFMTDPCNPNNPFRTVDGSCNNVVNVLWGASFTPFRRDLGPVYDNGIDSFRKAVDGKELPSARLISTTVNNAGNEKSPSFSVLHMTFGQIVNHDINFTPLSRGSFTGYEISESPIRCCNLQKKLLHPECEPIKIPKDDPFFGCFKEKCMEFVRAAPAEQNCYQGQRQQIDQQTGYLDASIIYGNQPSATVEIRSFVNGLLKGQLLKDGQILLPRAISDRDGECNTPERADMGQFCFLAGDPRVNEQLLLTFLQTLWAREHNRVATILRRFNRDWNDEKIFQEARRIVIAQLQQTVYAEYLPTVIGRTLMASSRLNPLEGDQQTTDYDPDIDASIANSFGAAAFRFAHSSITDNLLFINKQGEITSKEYSTLFFNPFDIYRRDGMCELAIGGIKRPMDQIDPLFTLEVAGKLFRGSQPFGLDLLALNTQRGRDHGLPPYNTWRVFCGLPKAENFDDLKGQMSQDRIDALKEVYNNVDDIDLFIGGVSETHIPGAIVGHTFACLLHNQFFRMKYGDRYWFEYRDGPGNFTGAQIEQLHRVTLARIMCDNLPELDYIQRWPLRNPGPNNPRVCCKSIRQYNLKPWNHDFNEEE